MLLHGIFPPITTPFYPDGRVYLKKLEHNVDRYSKTPVAGIVVLGSTGEAIMISDEERREVLKTAREACAPHKVLVAGTGAESAGETLRLTEYAADLGYDVALVRTPHFYRPQMQPANLLAFYRTVADRSPIPVLIYSVPVFTAYDMPEELIVELAEHPNIIGIKESGGDIEKIRRMAEATRHIKHSATVTETFAAVTPRMLKSGQRQARDAEPEAQLISVGALIGERSPSAAEASTSLGPLSARLEAVPSQSSAGNSTVATRGPTVPSSSAVTFAYCLLRNLCCMERGRRRIGQAQTRTCLETSDPRSQPDRHSWPEICPRPERLLWRPAAPAAASAHRRSEEGS